MTQAAATLDIQAFLTSIYFAQLLRDLMDGYFLHKQLVPLSSSHATIMCADLVVLENFVFDLLNTDQYGA